MKQNKINNKKVIVILGPTASGKSDVAVLLAKAYKGEVISADSRQIYKGLDIGTGKITKREMKGMPHHMIDIISPNKKYSVVDFQKKVNQIIPKILDQHKVPIICGGTGFYIQSIVDGIVLPEVRPNLKLRKELEKKSSKELFRILKKLDPRRAKSIDKNNSVRLIRAIEIAQELGGVPKPKKIKSPYNFLQIGIQLPEAELKLRINKRIQKWMKQGFINEIKKLHTGGLSFKRMEEIGLEYKLASLFVQGKIDKRELIKRMQDETWQYAKRQMTWFKRDKKIVWLTPDIDSVKKEVEKFIKNN